jgi:hypothetical protein
MTRIGRFAELIGDPIRLGAMARRCRQWRTIRRAWASSAATWQIVWPHADASVDSIHQPCAEQVGAGIQAVGKG